MKSIYLVEGYTGAYSDAQSWHVKAFDSKEKAEIFLHKCNYERDRIGKIRKELDIPYYEDGPKELKNKVDKKYSEDYTGTTYDIEEVEWEGE